MGFRDMNPKSAMRGNDKLEEILQGGAFDKMDAVKRQSFRPVGPVIAYEYYWFDIITKAGERKSIPKLCIDLDPYTDTYVSDVCPYRASGKGRQGRFYLVNGIWRKAQDEMPAKLKPPLAEEAKLRKVIGEMPGYPDGWVSYQKTPGSDTFTPVRVFIISASSAVDIARMADDNVVKGVTYDASDIDYGFDISYTHNPKGSGTGKNIYQKGEQTPLSDEEMDYLVYKLDVLALPSQADAEHEWRDLEKKLDPNPRSRNNDDNSMKGAGPASRLDDDAEDHAPRAPARRTSHLDDEVNDAPRQRGNTRGAEPVRSEAAKPRLSLRDRMRNRARDDVPF